MEWRKEGSFLLGTNGSGLNLLVHPTEKFKTTTIKVFCENPLDRNATRRALLPFVLRRGTRTLPDTRAMTRRLEDLYGASFDVDVFKVGERQVLEFRLQILNDRYAPPRARLLERGFAFVRDVLREPAGGGEGFDEEFFRKEKHHLRRLIESRINDKSRYAAERLIEEMCREEPFGIHELGDIPSLRRVTNRSLFGTWRVWVRSVPIDVYVVGEVDPEAAADLARKAFEAPGDDRAAGARLPDPVRRQPRRSRTVEEIDRVTQGKLALGYRTRLGPNDPLGAGLQFANAILGGGTFSKLFRHFREGASLAYYATSHLERIKGLVTLHAGIDPKNYARALRVIRRQVRDLREGSISDFEFQSAREHLLARIRAMEDSPTALIRSTLVARAAGNPLTVRQAIARVRKVTRDEVVAAARSLALDTIFFLRPRGKP